MLGAGKAGADVNAVIKTSAGSAKVSTAKQSEAELEKQFNAGIKMKNEQGAKRRGLGA